MPKPESTNQPGRRSSRCAATIGSALDPLAHYRDDQRDALYEAAKPLLGKGGVLSLTLLTTATKLAELETKLEAIGMKRGPQGTWVHPSGVKLTLGAPNEGTEARRLTPLPPVT